MIEDAVKKHGMSWVCAHCMKWWTQFLRGRKMCETLYQGKRCAGPIVGMDFPEYEGVLTNERIADHCFKCGAKSTGAAIPRGAGRAIGFCAEHEMLLHEMKVADRKPDQKMTLRIRSES